MKIWNKPLKKCTWELTTLCNLRCGHCGTRAGAQSKGQLSLDKCLSIADELADIGCEAVCLIGGEVTMFQGWDKVADRLIDRGVKTNIITNGYGINEDKFERILKCKIRTVCVSVDGMERTHNAVRGRSDCFAQLEAFIVKLNGAGKHVTAVTTLTKAVIGDLEAMYGFLAGHDVKIWQIQACSPFGNAAENIAITPDRADIQEALGIYRRLPKKPMAVWLGDNIGYYVEQAGDSGPQAGSGAYSTGGVELQTGGALQQFRGCAAGLLIAGIDNDGNVRGCESLKDDKFIEGNLAKTPLRDIWYNPRGFAYNRGFRPDMLTGRCGVCEYGRVCAGGCRSYNYFSHKKLYESPVCARAYD